MTQEEREAAAYLRFAQKLAIEGAAKEAAKPIIVKVDAPRPPGRLALHRVLH